MSTMSATNTVTDPPACSFCRIVAGVEPAAVVFADELAVAFLDRSPLFKGHTLVAPREHHETLGELPLHLVGPLFMRARTLAQLMETELHAAGSFVAMNNRVSQSVPHLHIHVVPRNRRDGLRGFFWPRQRYTGPDEMAAYAARLAAAYRS
jgi:histidine triad (HIT) family protein